MMSVGTGEGWVRGMGRARLPLLVATTAVVLAPLSGCTVPAAGATGVTVTAEGRPMGVVMVCHDHIDGATLYTDSGRAGDNDTVELGRWSSAEPVEGFATWPLDTGGAGWSAETPPRPLREDREHHLYGWTEDNSWSTGHVTFTLADLAALTPGRVRYADGDGHRTGSLADFRADACRNG